MFPPFKAGRVLSNRVAACLDSVGADLTYEFKELINEDISHGILTTYGVNTEFVVTQLPETAPFTVICHYDANRVSSGARALTPNIKLALPHIAPQESMHAKVYLLYHAMFLRLVVGSANLTPTDHSGMRQAIVYFDLPRRRFPHRVEHQVAAALSALMSDLGVDQSTLDFDRYDWTSIGPDVRMVVSIPGQHSTSGTVPLGHLALPHQILSEVTVQCSSVQSYPRFHQQLLDSLMLRPHGTFRVAFPSVRAVVGSAGGASYLHCKPEAAECIRAHRQSSFSDIVMKEGQPRLLSHSKLITAIEPSGDLAWVYLGSANLSAAAWGVITGQTITIRNHEAGFVFLSPNADVFEAIPYRMPPPTYQPNDVPYVEVIDDNRMVGSFDTPG
ncbi:Tyrosyl-DNA phosphodiesterase I [Carpediemonas membranifera]|uniref:Tyrosyl-DNA phosphodiesterase I n=1 Tax=Carpediemonas membranifera TaxID=201153 RepID=A0A8J6B0D5_9EUKA|nr:Tyrosyl-DNA phosphodiesterase I [Carpediemonas membranifera]|eukprot:KAG9395715.1 Tyrosyl-DNA phosphodiesterase I [Carpediemonas membranifera]